MTVWKWVFSISNIFYLVVILFTSLLIYFGTQRSILTYILPLVHGIALFGFLLKHSNFIKSSYFRLANIALGLYMITMALKLLHLPGASIGLIISFSLLLISYLLFFLKKKPITIIDILKLLLVISYCALVVFKLLHWPGGLEFGYAFNALALFFILKIIYDNRKVVNWLWK